MVNVLEHEPGVTINDEFKKQKVQLPDLLPETAFAALPRSLVIAVTDTGVGIDEANVPKLFNKFKQLDNKSLMPNIKGTGLGLAIAKGIIEGHGGIIGVVSKLGVGSTFYFTLPATIKEA
jgi:signal transduction histidine kinase